jgi:dolichyl-phosphate-mannose--protein O-mannosyl transferase
LILCDVFLYFFDLATIGASFASVRSGLSEGKQLMWCCVTGVCLGLCMSVKLTALGILATVGVHQLLCLVSSSDGWGPALVRGVKRACVILGIACVIFFGLWAWHLHILPYSGQGDNFMMEDFKKTLVTKEFPHKTKCPSVEYAARFDCGIVRPTQSSCQAKGCCWDPDSAASKCYYPYNPALNVTGPRGCPNRRNTWSDCGEPGITETACKNKDCCWDPQSDRAWCYHRGSPQRPRLSWKYQIEEVLRATWANNNGGAVMIHPAMSEWWEWPFMTGQHVPFGGTRSGGVLKALGNPGVYWSVAVTVLSSTVVLVVGLWRKFGAVKALLFPDPQTLASKKNAAAVKKALGVQPPAAGPVSDQSRMWKAATAVNAIGGGGFINPFITLLLGYYLNLVPYQLIERSKFTYHYIPALIVGMMFTVFVADTVLRVADLPLSGRSAWVVNRKLLARGIVCFLYICACAGFYYWALPYAYGVPLTLKQHRERMWVHAWANEDNWIFPKQK